MKNILLILILTAASSCLKVQKKSETEAETAPEQVPAPAVVEETRFERERVILTLNETLSLTQDLEIVADEVHLKANAKIYSNQFKLKIKTQKLLAEEGALIQTFYQLTASRRIAALNGGTVQINVSEVAEGNLQVHMNGQQGGSGKMGWNAGTLVCASGGGMNSGRSGSFFMDSEKSEHFFISTRMDIAAGGEPGEIWTNIWSMCLERSKYPANYKADNEDCNVSPPPAQAGTPGQICLKLKTGDLPLCEKF